MSSPDAGQPANVGYRLVIASAIAIPIQILAVGLRAYARSLTAVRYSAEDWLIVAALVLGVAQAGFCIGAVREAGIGYHIDYLAETSPGTVTLFLKYLFTLPILYCAQINLAKLSVLLMYKRLFPGRPVLIVLGVCAFIMIVGPVVMIITVLAACTPLSDNWAPLAVQATHCIDKTSLYRWASFPNIITDLIMLALPLPIVWKLKMSQQVKIGLTVTFMVGIIGLISSIFRFVSFFSNESFTDATWTAVPLFSWTVAEPTAYLVSACLLSYRPLLDKWRTKLGELTSYYGASSKNSGAATDLKSGGGGSGWGKSRRTADRYRLQSLSSSAGQPDRENREMHNNNNNNNISSSHTQTSDQIQKSAVAATHPAELQDLDGANARRNAETDLEYGLPPVTPSRAGDALAADRDPVGQQQGYQPYHGYYGHGNGGGSLESDVIPFAGRGVTVTTEINQHWA